MNFDLSQFYQVFFEEASEHLASMETLLLDIDVDTRVLALEIANELREHFAFPSQSPHLDVFPAGIANRATKNKQRDRDQPAHHGNQPPVKPAR